MTFSELVPWWVGWLGPAVFFLLGLLWIALIPALPLRSVQRRLANADGWAERAAIGWEGRITIGTSALIWLPLAIGLPLILVGPFAVVSPLVIAAVIGLLVLFRVVYLNWRFTREDLGQPLPGFREHMSGVARRWWPFLVVFAVGAIAPSELTSLWMIPWTALAVAALLGTRYLAEAWVWSGVAVPANDRLNAAVTAGAARVGAEPPKAFILRTHAVNAVALPQRNIVIFTQRMVDLLDDEELEAVAVHEIAHLNERRGVTRMRTLGLLAYLPIVAMKPLVRSGWVPLLLAFAVMFVILRIVKRTAAAEEARADESAIESSHHSYALGTGLLKAHREGLIPAIVKGDPHGPLHERLQLAGLEPDFEPVAARNRLMPFILPLGIFFVSLIVALVGALIVVNPWDGTTGTHVALALGWEEADVLWYVAEVAGRDGDFDRAAVFLQEAADLGEKGALASLPWVLGSSGRCDEVPTVYEELVELDLPEQDLESALLWLHHCSLQE
ncbi:MAG: M48 family metalloprotease [Acidimicrobiia bacterium]|nr:M48 family metalloprotease [Acidimicrobiia bacterium]